MFDEFSTREWIVIIGALLISGAVVAGGSVYITKNYLIGDRSYDPLTRTGGRPETVVPAAELLPGCPTCRT
jgi:hypothetical protein